MMRSTRSFHATTTIVGASLALLFVAACESAPPEPVAEQKQPAQNTQAAGYGNGDTAGQKAATPQLALPKPTKKKISAKPAVEVKPSAEDPVKGKWTLDDATKGLPEGKALTATIETDMGNIECKLFDDKAPITVANFIGLARGVRPWKTPEGKWEKKPAYDGTIFHRIIKGFMIQGGDAKKNGSGEAGYVIPDEVWEDANHDRPGLLCMANRGPNTNSAQFFITDEAAFHLDGGYTIFGECGPVETIHKIASVEVVRDQPTTPPAIKKVTITRK